MTAFPIILAGAGSVLGGITARRQNRAVRRSARETQERLNDVITQTRIDRIRNTVHLSREAQAAVGNTMNASPRGLAVIETVANRIAGSVASDQFAIDEEARRRLAAIHAEKRNVVNSANSQMSNVGLSAISGGLQGFQMGVGLQQGIKDLSAIGKEASSFAEGSLIRGEIRAVQEATAATGLQASRVHSSFIRQALKDQLARNMGFTSHLFGPGF